MKYALYTYMQMRVVCEVKWQARTNCTFGVYKEQEQQSSCLSLVVKTVRLVVSFARLWIAKIINGTYARTIHKFVFKSHIQMIKEDLSQSPISFFSLVLTEMHYWRYRAGEPKGTDYTGPSLKEGSQRYFWNWTIGLPCTLKNDTMTSTLTSTLIWDAKGSWPSFHMLGFRSENVLHWIFQEEKMSRALYIEIYIQSTHTLAIKTITDRTFNPLKAFICYSNWTTWIVSAVPLTTHPLSFVLTQGCCSSKCPLTSSHIHLSDCLLNCGPFCFNNSIVNHSFLSQYGIALRTRHGQLCWYFLIISCPLTRLLTLLNVFCFHLLIYDSRPQSSRGQLC